VIGVTFRNSFRRSAVEFQPRAVPKANALIGSIHHNKVNWPISDSIDPGYLDSLTAPASILATCFNNHFSSPYCAFRMTP
jgi:hypothetical protein